MYITFYSYRCLTENQAMRKWEGGGGIPVVGPTVLKFRTRYFYVLGVICKRKVSQNILNSRLGTADC